MRESVAAPEVEADEEEGGSVLRTLLPYLIGTALFTAALVLAVLKFSGAMGAGASSVAVVTFDVVKYANSTRAVASNFLKPGSLDEAGTLLLDLPERTRAAIERQAGEGVLVMVKQGVVQGQMRDITDDVLKELGLPTDVPTQDNTASVLDTAPTQLSNWGAPPARTPLPGAPVPVLP